MIEIHSPGLEAAYFLSDPDYRDLKLERTGLSYDEYWGLIAQALLKLSEQERKDAMETVQSFFEEKRGDSSY